MPKVTKPANMKGDFLVDYEEKVFEDVKAAPGEKALVTFHTVAFEGSIGIVNLLQATRLQRKGFKTSILLYGPGVTLGVQRGFPRLGDEAFPGHLNFNEEVALHVGGLGDFGHGWLRLGWANNLLMWVSAPPHTAPNVPLQPPSA